MIKQLQEELRTIDNDREYQRTIGVIHYLQKLKVGSWVTTPESTQSELVVSISNGVGEPFDGAEIIETLNGGCWSANDVEVVG